jgi:hypothetical protein
MLIDCRRDRRHQWRLQSVGLPVSEVGQEFNVQGLKVADIALAPDDANAEMGREPRATRRTSPRRITW